MTETNHPSSTESVRNLSIYLDTTVLLAYTLTKLVEKKKYKQTRRLIARVDAGEIRAITSFYALHEVLIFALRNAPNPEAGRRLGKDALLAILQTDVEILPMLTREEKVLHARDFSVIKDPSDVSHAISAYLHGCQIVVSYDRHFADVPAPLVWKTPAELV